MEQRPLRTTVMGSYPFPGWLEYACADLASFGADDRAIPASCTHSTATQPVWPVESHPPFAPAVCCSMSITSPATRLVWAMLIASARS